jgi:hypothetical protein
MTGPPVTVSGTDILGLVTIDEDTTSATCPAGSVLLRGGYTAGPLTGVRIVDAYADYPSTPGRGGTWTVTIGASGTITFNAFAECSP